MCEYTAGIVEWRTSNESNAYICPMQKIDNIIFDLGGVILDIDFGKTAAAFQALGVQNYPEFFSQHHASPLFQNLEIGTISPTTFYAGLRELTGIFLTDLQIRDAWNAMLGDYHREKMEYLLKLSQKYRLFLFSNTNQIHYDYFAPVCAKEFGRPLESYFSHANFSHTLGLRKPSPESFQAIIDEQKLNADRTLFVDDTVENIKGATQVGLHTFHLLPQMALSAIEDYL